MLCRVLEAHADGTVLRELGHTCMGGQTLGAQASFQGEREMDRIRLWLMLCRVLWPGHMHMIRHSHIGGALFSG